ncbi:MAG: glycosyltransferase [Candidatus Paceibacterota bacterium]|jgi:glycosyltransferase involved in cell wall biosynthesis
MSTPRVSIVIPTLREGPFLERTLKNLDGLTIPHEIIITDGGSADETLDVARRYTDKITVWTEPRRQTFGEAKNAGAALATGEYLVFIDADVLIPSPQAFFEEMLAAFDKAPNLVAMTVPLKPWPENHSLKDAFFSAPLNWFYIVSNNIFHSGNSSGEFQMVRAEAFKKIGGFGEQLAAGEDNELFRRLADIGRTLSYAKLCVQHSLRRPHKLGWLRTYYIWIKNGISVALRGRAAYKEWSVVR